MCTCENVASGVSCLRFLRCIRRFFRVRQLLGGILRFCDGGNERPGQPAPAAVLDVEVPDGAEHHCADKIDEQVRHGVVQSDVQIPVKPQVLSVDGYGVDAVDGDGSVAVGGVQHHGGDGLHHGVLLHIHVEQPVHAELKKLPQHAHRHGKAERCQRHVDGGQLKLDAAVAVEDVDEGEARGGAQEAGGGVEHGVPVGIGDEIALQLAQDLRREDKQQDDDLQRGRQLDAEVLLDKERQHEQRQHQQADKRALVLAADDGGYQRAQHDEPQHQIHREYHGLPPDGALQVTRRGNGLMGFLHSVSSLWADRQDEQDRSCFPRLLHPLQPPQQFFRFPTAVRNARNSAAVTAARMRMSQTFIAAHSRYRGPRKPPPTR